MGVAVVTGATGGIGTAVCESFANTGWDVVGIDRRRPAEHFPGRFIEMDLGASHFETRLRDAIRDIDDIAVLVNNAAVQVARPLLETSVADWQHSLQVNVVAAAVLIKESFPRMLPGSAVVNVASVHSVATSPGLAAYVTSKGAMVALTRAAAMELADKGIRVNCVLPGAIDTEMLRDGLTRAAGGHEEGLGLLVLKTPLQRVGQPEEIAEAILFLADEKRSSFITGQTLIVDGGATAHLSTE